MMLTPWNIYCEGARLRGVLKHAWIENEIESTTPERAVHRCTRPGGWTQLESDFPVRLQWLRGLVVNLADMFSPTELIDRCGAFADLDDDTKCSLRDAVEHEYLGRSGIEARGEPLTRAADRLDLALQEFRKVCSTEGLKDSLAGERAWGDVLNTAAELRLLLDQLPRGIVFP